jgi:opacity protein-like surface antigen
MIRRLLAFSVVSIALATAASAQEAVSPSGSHSSYTHSQLKQMIREAHTREQYSALADYYTGLQRDYLRKAEEDRQEWVERSKGVTWTGAKTPRPMDFSRDAYQFDMSKATKAESAAAKYGQLAAPKALAPAS